MDGYRSKYLFALVITALTCVVDGARAAESNATIARALLDDAELRAVTFIDALHGWAVGDRGALWLTDDGGEFWWLAPSGTDAQLSSVQFADESNGWAAGGSHRPYVNSTRGVLLRTADGGRTWEPQPDLLLAAIRQVKFFGPRGWVLAEPSAIFPSGVLFTDTGGQSWTPLVGTEPGEWNVADFADPTSAALAGSRGARGTVRDRGLESWQQSEFGLREPRALKMMNPNDGWLAGDGGLLLATRDGGASWQAPPQEPTGGEQFDWRAITTHDRHVWLAGAPGTRIMHSADAGATWESLATGQPLPINALAMIDEQHGWAVGALGTILRTTDGGHTWTRQRGARTRAALLALYSDAERAPLEALARLAANEGMVTAVELLARRDAEPDTVAASTDLERSRAALIATGCSAVDGAWGFPLRQLGLHPAVEQIVDGWNRMYAGRGVERLEEHLVRSIRQWRPEVVLTSAASPGGDDPLGHLVNQVVLRAVTDAADGQKFPEQISRGGLAVWSVKKIVGSQSPGKMGTININTTQLAPRLNRSLVDYAADARGLLDPRCHQTLPNTLGFRLYLDTIPQGLGQQDFFSGITLAPGSDARRELPTAARGGLEAMREIAERHRNLQAILAHSEKSGRGAAVFLGQIGELTRGLDAQAAGQALFDLAHAFHRDGHNEFAAATFQMLVEKYPTHPRAVPALVWLSQFWSSGEMACRAMPRGSAGRPAVPAVAQRAVHPEAAIPAASAVGVIHPAGAITQTGAQVELPTDPTSMPARYARAVTAGRLLAERDAQAWSELTAQFPLAVARGRSDGRELDRFFTTLSATRPHDAWWECARGEQWLQAGARGAPPKPAGSARRSSRKPRLDGELDEEMWQQAERLELASPLSDDAEWPTAVMLAYDEEFLYLAISCRCASGCHYASDERTRLRDTDLSAHDRVEVLIDVDRDFTTFYRLVVDYRGWAGEECWGDRTWNPRWFVASAGGETSWTIEAALPLAELSPEAVGPKTVWALGLQRVAPGAGLQGWTRPATVAPRGEGCGYLIFE